jgi:hypothetical protein
MQLTRALAFSTCCVVALTAQRTATLQFQPLPEFDLVLPAETWTAGSTGFALAHRGGPAFAAVAEGLSLRVDSDGDGRLDATFKGGEHHVLLRGRRPDGSRLDYALRVVTPGNGGFRYSCGGTMAGTVEGVHVRLIDQDNDGLFGEVGVDGLVVGGRAASFVSRVVNLGGRLFELEVDAAGRTATTTPYDGPAGHIEVRSGLSLAGELAAAVVSDLAGKWSFEVSSVRPVRVPAGVYVFSGGLALKGEQRGRLRAGQMRPVVVRVGETAKLEWGAPLRVEFAATRQGDQVRIASTVRYFGRAGEEWLPPRAFDRVPKLEVYDAGKRNQATELDTC